MNRLIPNTTCWVCSVNMRQLWDRAGTDKERAELSRQIENGLCDGCQRERQSAAIEYEHAAAEVRTLEMLGARPGRGINAPFAGSRQMRVALDRIATANDRCVLLKMWPATRATKRPTRFYREDHA